MRIRTIVRCFFAIEAFAIFVALPEFIAIYGTPIQYSPVTLAVLAFSLTYASVLGLLAGFTAWRMNRPGDLTRTAGLAASLMNLIVFPIGTIVAIAGISCFARNTYAGGEPPAPKHKPLPGDGTSKATGILFITAQVVVTLLGLFYVLPWAGRKWLGEAHVGVTSNLLTLLLATYVSALGHELGHIAMGWAAGFQLVGFRVGPFELKSVAARWRFHFRGNALLGGHAAMVPRNADRLRERAMMMTAGGPLGSAALAITSATIIVVTPMLPGSAGAPLLLITFFAACDFVFNLMPLATGVLYSDGARLFQLWRRGPWADYLCSIYFMGLCRTTPMQPRDWPRDMVERVAVFARQLPDAATILGTVYAHFEDSGDLEKAFHYLEQACDRVHPNTEYAWSLARERAWFEAFHRANAAEGQRWLKEAKPDPGLSDHWRAHAAVALAQHDLYTAEEAWRKGMNIVAKLPGAGVYELDRRHFRDLELALSRIGSTGLAPIEAGSETPLSV